MVNGRVNGMVKARTRPPSRTRYEEAHPVIAIRVDKETSQIIELEQVNCLGE